jgi:hypothetical protein
MGTGKTFQAIVAAAAYGADGPLLVVCPASLRAPWAEELEIWYPGLESLAVITQRDDLFKLDALPLLRERAAGGPPQLAGGPPATAAVVTSYTMLALHTSAFLGRFATVVLDEAHVLRTALPGGADAAHTKAAAELCLPSATRVLALTGTPALNKPYDLYRLVDIVRPRLLGDSRRDFAVAYCGARPGPSCSRDWGAAYGGGVRLGELHMLLVSSGAMLRRTKADVATQLPPLSRQVIRLPAAQEETEGGPPMPETGEAAPAQRSAAHDAGARKAGAACAWLRETLLRPLVPGEEPSARPKVVIFAHHVNVMNQLQRGVLDCPGADGAASARAPYVRLDGSADGAARAAAVLRFRTDPACRAALVSITAGGTGLDFSSAGAVVFAELPGCAADLQQAEARVHRRGCRGRVCIYFLVSDRSWDERQWPRLALQLTLTRVIMAGAPPAGHDADPLPVDAVLRAARREAGPRAAPHSPPPAPSTQPMDGDGESADEGGAPAPPPPAATQPMDGPEAPLGGNVALDAQSDWPPAQGQLYFWLSDATGRLHVFLHPAEAVAAAAAAPAGGPPPLSPHRLRRLCSVPPATLAAALEGGPPALAGLPWPLCCSDGVSAPARSRDIIIIC